MRTKYFQFCPEWHPPVTEPNPEYPAVSVTNLRKVYEDEGRGQVVAVEDLSFQCYPGEIFGLLGTNGAGKTTTLSILATLLKPLSGDAEVMSYSVNTNPDDVRRVIGYVSTSTGLWPRLTCRETLDLSARINGYPDRLVAERVQLLLERFGMLDYAEARVGRLSTGMKQKVSIARSVAHDPAVVILDEPTTGLDVLGILEFHRLIRELRDEGKCVIFSTHIMSEAEKLCDRIGIMYKGRLLECGTLEELRATVGDHYLEEIFVSLLRQNGFEPSVEFQRSTLE